MSIVETLHQMLNIGLECILIRVCTGRNVRLDTLELLCKVHRRLLVGCWGGSEVGQGALKLHCGVVIVEEAQRHSLVERHANKTFESIRCVEEIVSCSRIIHISFGTVHKLEQELPHPG